MPPPAVEITERLLSDAGGWQALKEARGLWEAGKVASAAYEPPFLRGVVRDGDREFRTGLRIVTRTNIENLCTCRMSRERGMVCAHALAVGMRVLKGNGAGGAAVAQAAKVAAPVTERGPYFLPSENPEAILHVVVAPSFTSGWEKDSITLGAEIEAEGKRLLAHAWLADRQFRVSGRDAAAIQVIREVNGGELPGMMALNRMQCRRVFEALAGHPRVTIGRGETIDPMSLLPAAKEEALAENRAAEESAPLPGQPRFRLQIEGSLNRLAAKLNAIYGERIVPACAPGCVSEPFKFREEGDSRWRVRNPEAETAALGRLMRAGFSQPDQKGEMSLKGERPILRFLAGDLPALEREWKVELGARFANINETIERIRPRVEVQSSGTDWFELSISLRTSEGQTFSSAEIQRLLQMGQNHVRLKNGATAIFDTGMLDELGQALADCDPKQPRPGAYRIHRAQAGYLGSVLGDGAEITGTQEWRTWTGMQLAPDRLTPRPLGALEEVLRPYQKQGVYWMDFLARNGFGGILADEMGLGKTLQALAFLDGLRARVRAPALIVCPSSLVQNWAREAAKFTPHLRVLALEGADRHAQLAGLPETDLAITSYALLRRDADRYGAVEFSAVVLDEAQHIKNPETQNAQAAGSLKARHRLVLTGTPLENSVRDLWSILNFAMPGYLGSRADFKERYEQPILQGDAGPAKARLAKRIRPFLLRRTKRAVYKELPEKLEQVLYCELTEKQRELYEKLLSESRRQISDLDAGTGGSKGRMLMLTALLRLRQACCDLRLLGVADIAQSAASAKLELLDELLREAIDGGHRVLIFSQFVAMLKLQKAALETADIPYCYLDGQTKDRMGAVDQFQNDPGIPVFLISLKAGGVGLNLTAADTVVHFDPWWNPAVEAQATDRAHRIGQEKVVTSYKLIARGTVEEKILKLQESKRGLLDAIESEEPVMSGLSTAEIQELLA